MPLDPGDKIGDLVISISWNPKTGKMSMKGKGRKPKKSKK